MIEDCEHPDTLSGAGADRLARLIEAYWKGRGKGRVNAWVAVEISATGYRLYCVRSDLLCGLPPRPKVSEGEIAG